MSGLLLVVLELPKLVFVAVLGAATGIGAAGKSAYEMVVGPSEACHVATIGDQVDGAVPPLRKSAAPKPTRRKHLDLAALPKPDGPHRVRSA